MSDQQHHEPTSRDEVVDAFSRVVEMISRTMVQVFSRQLEPSGITVLQFHALRAVAFAGPELDMSTIASLTGLPASSVTSVVDRLSERGLLERRHDNTDRRRVVASLTTEGASVFDQIQQQQHAYLVQLLETSDTEEIAICLRVFERIGDRMHTV